MGIGPFKIIASLGPGLYKIADYYNSENVIPRVNGVHLKKCNQQSESLVSLL